MDMNEHLESLYLKSHLTMAEIGKIYNVSRQRIHQYIKESGIDASHAERFFIACDKCNDMYSITRKQWRKQSTHYCSMNCYLQDRKNTEYKPHRNGQREARRAMTKHIGRELLTNEIVHHIDGNCSNNNLNNLVLYPTHAAHIRDHHVMRQNKYKID